MAEGITCGLKSDLKSYRWWLDHSCELRFMECCSGGLADVLLGGDSGKTESASWAAS